MCVCVCVQGKGGGGSNADTLDELLSKLVETIQCT